MSKTIKLRLKKTHRNFIVLYFVLNRSKLFHRIGFILIKGSTKYVVFNLMVFLQILKRFNIAVSSRNSSNSLIWNLLYFLLKNKFRNNLLKW